MEKLDENTLRMFRMWVVVCADSVDRLRRCDVQRALEQADNGGERERFAAWLSSQRPDLAGKIESENAYYSESV